MKAILAAALITIGLGGVPAVAQTAQTKSGEVEGKTESGISSFLGIPYAAPPVGENRWRAPQPVKAWSGVREATSFGNDCMQTPFPPHLLPALQGKYSEDCLYLNVWKPAGAKPGAKLPVMVWIHGGGFVSGGTSTPVYSGKTFASDGIVFVSLNYRLGRFGFFAHPALASEGFGGNFGFLDQIAALKWVHNNVSAFGGDPEHVTVFGESAGGGSVHMLLQSPMARGLFEAAIIESGGGRNTMLPPPSMAQAAEDGWRFAPVKTAAELRALPADKVVGKLGMGDMEPGTYSGPMLDGRTLMGEGVVAAKAGVYADVPVIVGSNSADGFPMVQDKDKIFAAFGDHAAEARAFYDPKGDKSALEVATQTSADAIMREPARAIARALAGRGQKVWLYRFAHNGTQVGVKMGGAPHASEIPYVFDLPGERLQKLDTGHDAEVAATMHRYWVNFAKTYDPNGGGNPAWPVATPDTDKVQLFGTDSVANVTDPRTAVLDFRESLLEK